jgi:hypothetical protein
LNQIPAIHYISSATGGVAHCKIFPELCEEFLDGWDGSNVHSRGPITHSCTLETESERLGRDESRVRLPPRRPLVAKLLQEQQVVGSSCLYLCSATRFLTAFGRFCSSIVPEFFCARLLASRHSLPARPHCGSAVPPRTEIRCAACGWGLRSYGPPVRRWPPETPSPGRL